MGIAETTITAAQQYDLLPGFGEIGDQCRVVFLIDLRTDWDFEHGVGAAGAMAVLAHAGLAVLGEEMLLVAIVDERVEPVDRDCDHVTTLAAVATIGAAKLNEFLAAERNAAVAAVARADIDLGFVKKFHRSSVGPITRTHNRKMPKRALAAIT